MEGSSPSRQTVIIDRSTDANVQRCYQLQRFAAILQQTIKDKGEDAPQHYVKTANSESFKLNLAFAKKNHLIKDINDDKVRVPQEWFEEGDRKLAAHLGLLTKWRNSLGKTVGNGGAATAPDVEEVADAAVEDATVLPDVPSSSQAASAGQQSGAPAIPPIQEVPLTTTNSVSIIPNDPGRFSSILAGRRSEAPATASNRNATASIVSGIRSVFGGYHVEGGFPPASSSSPSMWQTGAAAGKTSGLSTVPGYSYSNFAGQHSETPAATADRAKFTGARASNAFTEGIVPPEGIVPGGFPAEDEVSAQQPEELTPEELAQEMADNKEMRRWYRQWYARHKQNKAAARQQNRDSAMAQFNNSDETPVTLASSALVDDSLNRPATQKHARRTNTPASSATPAQVNDRPNEPETRKGLMWKSKPAPGPTLQVRSKEKPAWKV
ncbi:hypothetical protein CGCVW01_v013836 [Colletotrichum viniferum]|nr:hypothetical protein CGCVW01_v013836 [Colletotrichum viniferum]